MVDWFGVADRHRLRTGTTEDYKAIEELVPVLAVDVLGNSWTTWGGSATTWTICSLRSCRGG